MAESNFGIMELLQKLLKERGGAISEKEMGIMSGATETGKVGSGYESFLDKNRFDRPTTSNYTPNEMQTLDPLANTPAYSNATTNALTNMRGLQTGAGSVGAGSVSNKELQNFKIGASYVDDGALGGYLTHYMPNLTRMGVGNIDLNVPPQELRNQINAMTAQPRGAMSGSEYDFMVDGNSQGYNFTGDGVSEQAMARMRTEQGIQPNLGGGMDAVSQRETEALRRSQLADVGMQSFGNPSDIDVNFAQALSGLSSREQMEIISATQGMTTDAQVENFKRQYLRGKISPYELEAQSNLGF